ncbi:MAG: hypothetical protein AAFV59_16640, partial [Pseudomonadota bacterium]
INAPPSPQATLPRERLRPCPASELSILFAAKVRSWFGQNRRRGTTGLAYPSGLAALTQQRVR